MPTDNYTSVSKPLGSIFGANTRNHYQVPIFQRGYEWGKKQVDALWRDIYRFQEAREEGRADQYLLGPIVTLPSDKDTMGLLDGQQRLATITILLSVLRDISRQLGTPEGENFARDIHDSMILKEDGNYALTLGQTDDIYFRETIQTKPPLPTKPTLRTHSNILAARKLLEVKLRSVIGDSSPSATLAVLRQWRQTLRSDILLVEIQVASERDAFRLFETLNDRGLRLAVPDLLLNFLLWKASDEKDRLDIRRMWTDMIEQLGKRDIGRFLRHLWVSKFGDLKSQDLYSALAVRIEEQQINSVEFARLCSAECTQYVHLINQNESRLKGSTVYVRSILQDLDVEPALPLLLSALTRLPETDFVRVCQWIIVFFVKHSILADRESSTLESVLFSLACEVREKVPDGKEGDKALTNRCVKYIKETLTKASPSDTVIDASIDELVLSPDSAKYIMSRIATRMQTNTKEVRVAEANLEHIYPIHPDPDGWGGRPGQAIMGPLLWHIGNLTMLGVRLNNSVANKEFPDKKPYYAVQTELEISKKIAADYTEWTEGNIQLRAKSLLPTIHEIWSFRNSSRV